MEMEQLLIEMKKKVAWIQMQGWGEDVPLDVYSFLLLLMLLRKKQGNQQMI